MTDKPRVLIVVSGGVVQSVWSDRSQDVKVAVLDHDNPSIEEWSPPEHATPEQIEQIVADFQDDQPQYHKPDEATPPIYRDITVVYKGREYWGYYEGDNRWIVGTSKDDRNNTIATTDEIEAWREL